jgi:hypothetical protein
MQNRYTGDIGDYSKLGLLRFLHSAGFSIGLNWYLTPDETHNGDGRHVDYLKQEKYRVCDPSLWAELGKLVKLDNREVRYMESDAILQATFFSDCLDFSDNAGGEKRKCKPKAERVAFRADWFERSLARLAGKDIVCVDPDNGLVVPSAKGRPKENKYVLPEELARYYAQGSTVIYYQHKARYKDDHYTKQLNELLRREDLPGASGLALKFEKVSQRYYMFLIQPRHRAMVENTVNEMLATDWGDYFRLL